MFRSLLRGLGRIALTLATMLFLAAVSVFVLGSFILTWPILRLSPRDRRIKAGMDFAQSTMALLQVFSERSVRKLVEESLTPEPESTTEGWRCPKDNGLCHNDGCIGGEDCQGIWLQKPNFPGEYHG